METRTIKIKDVAVRNMVFVNSKSAKWKVLKTGEREVITSLRRPGCENGISARVFTVPLFGSVTSYRAFSDVHWRGCSWLLVFNSLHAGYIFQIFVSFKFFKKIIVSTHFFC